jgi:hypothetical protein
MIKSRLIGKEEVRRALWDIALSGLDPDGGIPTPVGTGIRDYCLGSDVEEAQLEIGARLREQLVDEISERIAQKIPHLRALELLEIRRAYLEALAPLLGR